MCDKKFEIILSEGAAKEYKKLDNSVIGIVNNAIDDLEFRADEVGKPLKGNLYGCKEKKLRNEGIRIIYKIEGNRVDVLRIVYILAIEKRDRGNVFKIASKRNNIKNSHKNSLNSWNIIVKKGRNKK